MLPKGSAGYLAAGAGLAFLGYCVYFDHKRRNSPDFRQKLRERRRNARLSGGQSKGRGGATTEYPDLSNPEAAQKFFLQELQLGEELLGNRDVEGGVEHLANAVAVCSQPQQLLGVMQQSVPPQIIQLILQRLPQASARIASASLSTPGNGARSDMAGEDEMD